MHIKVSDIAKELDKDLSTITQHTEALIKEALTNLAIASEAKLHEIAHDKLKGTLQDYTNAISLNKVSDEPLTFILRLDPVANWIEEGFDSYDMKPGLLHGPKAKMGKNGPYNTVPFRHHPFAAQSRTPLSMRTRRERIQNELNRVVQKYGLSKIMKGKGGKVLQGKVATLPKSATKIKELQGLTKYQKTYNKTTQGLYLTFRRVSKKSAPGSWIHPGYKGLHAFEELQTYLLEETRNIIKKLL